MRKKELRKIVIFGAQDDAKVIAAGSGTVLSIKPDSEFGHVIRIDHGNGYITVYRYSDSPKVKEGDDVTKGQLLFEVNSSYPRKSVIRLCMTMNISIPWM